MWLLFVVRYWLFSAIGRYWTRWVFTIVMMLYRRSKMCTKRQANQLQNSFKWSNKKMKLHKNISKFSLPRTSCSFVADSGWVHQHFEQQRHSSKSLKKFSFDGCFVASACDGCNSQQLHFHCYSDFYPCCCCCCCWWWCSCYCCCCYYYCCCCCCYYYSGSDDYCY